MARDLRDRRPRPSPRLPASEPHAARIADPAPAERVVPPGWPPPDDRPVSPLSDGATIPSSRHPLLPAGTGLPLTWRPSGRVGVGLDGVSPSGGGGDVEGAGSGLGDVPAGLLFDLVVGAAERAEVTRAGQSALVVRDRVVEVGVGGGLPAGGLAAGPVAGLDELADPRRGPVGRGGSGMGAPARRGSVGGVLAGGAGLGAAGGPQDRGLDAAGHVRLRWR